MASHCRISWRSVKPLPRYADSSILQDGSRRHFGFLKIQIFNGQTDAEGRTVSPCQISSKSVKPLLRYDDFSIFSKIAAVRHLGFVMRVFGPFAKGIRWSLSLCKIWLESILQFWWYACFSISPFWLGNVYSRLQNWGFWGFDPLNGTAY